MEARIASCLLLALSFFSLGANYTTPNFVVRAPSPQFARQVGELAEKYRRQLATKWLGSELPQWKERCPITVRLEPHAGGETSFVFIPDRNGGSRPSQWRMKVFGPAERILDSVLPHEITHTIFASHFGRPLPRWADEGACTTVEHESERKRNRRMLIEFLTSQRGIPFNHMFAMKQYPRDILPLYAQGHSLAKYLIQQKGHRHFVDYIGEGMERERRGRVAETWNQVTNEYYGYDNLSELQIDWLAWVRDGSPRLNSEDNRPDTKPGLGASIAEASQPTESPSNSLAKSESTPLSLTQQRNAGQRRIGSVDKRIAQANQAVQPTRGDVTAQSGQALASREPPVSKEVAQSDNFYLQQMQQPSTPAQSSKKLSFQSSNASGQPDTSSQFQPGSISRSHDLRQLLESRSNAEPTNATSSLGAERQNTTSERPGWHQLTSGYAGEVRRSQPAGGRNSAPEATVVSGPHAGDTQAWR